jgi:hypothetical protein
MGQEANPTIEPWGLSDNCTKVRGNQAVAAMRRRSDTLEEAKAAFKKRYGE